MNFILLGLALLFSPAEIQASGLARENQIRNAQKYAADLPQTLIVRINKADGSVAVHHSLRKLPPEAAAAAQGLPYLPMKSTARARNSLAGEGSKAGWYFYWYAYSFHQPAYSYLGYNYYYQPYHTAYFPPFTYTYYRWQ